jgi:hypothetical protein
LSSHREVGGTMRRVTTSPAKWAGPGPTHVRVSSGARRPQASCLGRARGGATPNRWWSVRIVSSAGSWSNGRGPSLDLWLGGWAWVSCPSVVGSERDGTRPTDADGEGDERGTRGRKSAPSAA